jgi:RNA polymerase sigma-70 factor (ECF subfamily)
MPTRVDPEVDTVGWNEAAVMPPAPPPDVLRAAAEGDVRAQAAVFEDWLGVVLGWCMRLGGGRIDAEDAAHDAMLIVLTRLDRLEQPDRFGAWVYGIVRRVLKDHRNRAWVRRWTGREVPDVQDPRRDQQESVAHRQLVARIHEVLSGLPDTQRQVLVLCDLEERTAPEVAELLGIPVGTVASRLRAARQRFERTARRRGLWETVEQRA